MSKATRNSLSELISSSAFDPDPVKDVASSSSALFTPHGSERLLTLPSMKRGETFKSNFDFGDIPSEIKLEILNLEHAIVVKLSSAIIAIGEDLLQMQVIIERHCTRNTWTRYLQKGLPFSETTARNYMKAARAKSLFPESATVAESLSPTALYIARKASEQVLHEIERRIERGEIVKRKDVENLIKADAETRPVADMTPAPVEEPVLITTPPETDLNVEEAQPDTSCGIVDAEHEQEDSAGAQSYAAAKELIARLSGHFNNEEILALDYLWQVAGPGALQQQLLL